MVVVATSAAASVPLPSPDPHQTVHSAVQLRAQAHQRAVGVRWEKVLRGLVNGGWQQAVARFKVLGEAATLAQSGDSQRAQENARDQKVAAN